MRTTLLALLLALSLPVSAQAASYQKTDGTVVDPIQSVLGGPLPYLAPNLEPFVSTPGASLAFAVLDEADLYVADLRNVNLTRSSLDGANLGFALLIDALLVETRLVGADLSNAALPGADLTNSIVGQANLSNANLIGANLSGANPTQSDLMSANLTDADLTGTGLRSAFLVGAMLDGALYDELTIFASGRGYLLRRLGPARRRHSLGARHDPQPRTHQWPHAGRGRACARGGGEAALGVASRLSNDSCDTRSARGDARLIEA